MLQPLLLLMEDDELIRYAYMAMLRHAGYAVLEAANGAEGLQQARRHRPDLILLDLNMPVLDGWETMRRLRSDPVLASVPVILLSAEDLDAMPRALAAAGFRAWLGKPVSRLVLLETVRRCLENTDTPPPPLLPLPA